MSEEPGWYGGNPGSSRLFFRQNGGAFRAADIRAAVATDFVIFTKEIEKTTSINNFYIFKSGKNMNNWLNVVQLQQKIISEIAINVALCVLQESWKNV